MTCVVDDRDTEMLRRIGKRLEMARTMLGYSQEELARLVGKKRSVISNYESGKTKQPIDVLQRVADAIGVDVSWFFAEEKRPTDALSIILRDIQEKLNDVFTQIQTQHQSARLPVYHSVQAGPWASVVGDGVIDWIAVPSKWRADFCVVARGDSMKPTILDGDVLAVKIYRGETIRSRTVVVAKNADNEYTVKRYVITSAGGIQLRGDSPVYGVLDASEWQIQGIVVGLLRELG